MDGYMLQVVLLGCKLYGDGIPVVLHLFSIVSLAGWYDTALRQSKFTNVSRNTEYLNPAS